MKKTKFAITFFFVVGTIAMLTAQSVAYPPFLAKARKFGAKDCTFCHVNAGGGEPFNARGKWLINEKARRKADTVDPEWLVDYKAGKSAKKKKS